LLYDKERKRAFSSEVDTGSRWENASKQKTSASVLIQSEPIVLYILFDRLHFINA
jgi:hypothetical protein